MFSLFKKKNPREKLKEFFDKYPDVFVNAIKFHATYDEEEVESDWGRDFDWTRYIRYLHSDNGAIRFENELDDISAPRPKEFLGLGFFTLPIWNQDNSSWEDKSKGKFNKKGKFNEDKFDNSIFLFGDKLAKLAEKAGISISARQEIISIRDGYNSQHVLVISGPNIDDLYMMIQAYKTEYQHKILQDNIPNAMNQAQKKTKYFPKELSNIIIEYMGENESNPRRTYSSP